MQAVGAAFDSDTIINLQIDFASLLLLATDERESMTENLQYDSAPGEHRKIFLSSFTHLSQMRADLHTFSIAHLN